MRLFLLLLATVLPLAAQQSPQRPAWIVKQAWVRAHEDFLASDVMQGRGSATRDEAIAATYVGSQFESFGLKPAPGMKGYVDAIAVEKPVLSGQATLNGKGWATDLQEGSAFYLFSSSAKSVTAKLLKVKAEDAAKTKIEKDTAVLLTGIGDKDFFETAGPLMGQRPALLLAEGNASISGIFSKYLGEHTQVAMGLPGSVGHRDNVVILRAAAAAQIASLADGAELSLTVQNVAAGPRFTYNALGYLPGTTPSAGTLLLTAHLDHVGIGKAVNGDSIYNGADDDAAGTTAVLELARALAAGPRLRRSVLFVCFGSEEEGDIGSSYFREHPPVPLKSIVANLEFEMIGAQDPKMPKGVLLLSGWDRSNFGPTLKQHGALLGADPYPDQHFFERSDNYALAEKGVIAHTAAGYAMPPYYHQPDDEIKNIDFAFMTRVIQSMVEPLRWLADSAFVPKWNPGGEPK